MTPDRWFVVAVVAFMVVFGCVVMAVRNARLNRRDDERDMLLLPAQDLDLPRVGYTDADRLEDRLVSGPQTVLADPPGVGEPREDQLDEEWADQLAAMNAEHLNVAEHLERVHARPWWGLECDCETFEDHERAEWERITADEETWLDLARTDARLVSVWIGRRGAFSTGRVPSVAGWPSDDWRGEMIPSDGSSAPA